MREAGLIASDGVPSARNCGRIVGFKQAFVTLYHGPGAARGPDHAPPQNDSQDRRPGETQSFLPRSSLSPPYRITRPFCRFDLDSDRIAFDLDGREVWVARDEVELEKGSLGARGQATLVSLTLRSVTRVRIWYGPPPEEEAAAGKIGLKVKPLRIAVATCVAIFFYLMAGQIDPLGALSAADSYSNALYQQVYRAANYEKERERQYPGPGSDPPKVVVVEVLEEDLTLFEESWPVSYDFHAWVLERLSDRQPAAVFVDIAFIDDRSLEGDEWEDESEALDAVLDTAGESAKEKRDSQRFFRGASAYLGETIAAYRNDWRIPLFFAAKPCFLPFFLPEDVPKDGPDRAGTFAVDVPGGRFHRQGARYPLWNHQPRGQRCLRDVDKASNLITFSENTTQKAESADSDDNVLNANEPAANELRSGREQDVSNEPDRSEQKPLTRGASNEIFARPLPSAACAVFDAVRNLAPVGYAAALCPEEKLRDSAVDVIDLHWSTRSFTMALADGELVPRNGRYACRELPGSWWKRLWLLIKDYDKDPLFEFVSPLRQICPPFKSYRAAEILNDGASFEDLQGAIVVYAQNLTGLSDSFRPPAHWPLNGAYFHAMAIDNLLTYRGSERLLQKTEILGLPASLLLMLVGFIAVVPIWEYGLILLLRVERAGGMARTRAAAFRFYGIWLGGFLLLPLLAAAIVVELIFVTTLLFPGVALNFIGLLSLIGVRSLPRLWRLMPPLWLGLGGWGRGKPEEAGSKVL